MRLLLTLALAAGSAGYLCAGGRVTLADRGTVASAASPAPAASAALVRLGRTVGASQRAQNAMAAVAAGSPGQAPDEAALQAAAGPASVTMTDDGSTPAANGAAATATPGSTVSETVVVIHDGTAQTVSTNATTVGGLLQQLRVKVGSLDKVSPAVTAGLVGIGSVRVVRVTQTTERQNIDVAFKHTVKHSSSVELGVQTTAQAGANGLSQRVYRKTYLDGKLVSSVLATTQVVRAPRDEIKLIGTHVPSFAGHSGSRAGMATWYGATGLSSASPTLPFGTVVRVTNLATGRSINVVIRDRGPYAGSDRVIDLSPTAFAQIGALGSGIVSVKIDW